MNCVRKSRYLLVFLAVISCGFVVACNVNDISSNTEKADSSLKQIDLFRESAGFGDFIWFNVQIYDERYRLCPLYAAQDTADPSAKMIYAPPTTLFTDQSVHDGQWVTFSKDIYPVIQEALDEARARGYLSTSPDNADFAVSSVILGWEVPGVNHVQMQVRNLRLNIAALPDPSLSFGATLTP